MTAKPEPKDEKAIAEEFLTNFAIFHRLDPLGGPMLDVPAGNLEIEQVFFQWRKKIEASAKRDGAREALERAAQWHDTKAVQFKAEAARLEGLHGYGYLVSWHGEQRGCHERSAKEIRSLIEPTPVEPEVKPEPLYACNKCGYCGPLEIHPRYLGADNCNYRAFLIPPPAPSKAEELLPLGHEFVPYDRDLGPCKLCHFPLPDKRSCHHDESAHRGKRGVE